MGNVSRVVIAGGGVGGLTAALAFKQRGVDVEVHEKHPEVQGRATGFTIWSYAIRHLIELGIPPERFEEIGGRVEFTDIRNGKGDLIEQMPVGEVSRKLGAPTYDVNRAELQQTLIDAVGPESVHMGSEVTGLEQDADSATLLLAGGGRATGDLAIGGDGVHSVMRDVVAGAHKSRYAGTMGWGALIPFEHELMPANHHVEIWARHGKAGVAWVGPGVVRWYEMARVDAGTTRTKADLLARADELYPLLRAAIEATPEDRIVATEAWDQEPLSTWHDGRAVLLGDAAHATTPFAAMGACMTIEDAVTLRDHVMSDAPLQDALAAYQQTRKQKAEDTVKHGRTMGHVSQVGSPFLAWLRDEGFKHMPPSKIEEVATEMASGA